MMKCTNILLDQLNHLPYFRKNTFLQFGAQLRLSDATLDTYISRFLKSRNIVQLKRGLYISSEFFSKNRGDGSYHFYLANILRTPSYVSSWTALQYYNLATEAVHRTVSVTPKVTRSYQTRVGNFSYQSVKKELFGEFVLVKGKPDQPSGKFDFFIASPAKALFDLLYFRTRQFRGVTMRQIRSLIDELRIESGEMGRKELSKFYTMIRAQLHE